ncbi:LysR family transcriptional regulator [Pseudomonas sp. PB101]|uniref:LysR family transcriptional regulator n=1 Tax=Pseudomonas sp. PB101 TaxID=2495428 RepID=UPI001365226F|nr:LysR family transcriptional regulator [Pseudomonas sp. PB101]MVW84794.1 LysR family transcriptional regulator [Pseudomonas sp. PB101]
MRFNHLDLNLLVALDVMLEECNITRAAERLHMTQSAISGILSRLREYFGDDLLIYVNRKMQPTPYALELAGPIREVLLLIKSSITAKPDFDPMTSNRHFKIITSDYLVSVLLSKVMVWANRNAPNITFEIIGVSDHSNEMLTRGEVDFIIMPDFYITADHPYVLLFEEDHVCVLWDENPDVGEQITLEQYITMGHVSAGFGRSRKLSIEEWFMNQYGVSRRIEVICNDFNTLAQVVIGTNRVATTHRMLAELYAQHLPLKVLSTPVKIPATRECMIWHKSMEGDTAHGWLRALISKMASNLNDQRHEADGATA